MVLLTPTAVLDKVEPFKSDLLSSSTLFSLDSFVNKTLFCLSFFNSEKCKFYVNSYD